MRFLLTEEFWVLDALNAAEWHFISELPEVAAGTGIDKQSRERLYPSPLTDDELLNEDSFNQLEDWEEIVKPDLESSFKADRERVERDLADVSVVPREEVDPSAFDSEQEMFTSLGELKRLVIPLEHSDAWYSTLNQARLLLNEAHSLAESSERLLFMTDQEKLEPRLAMKLAQYEMYSAIQSILVENVMQ